MPVYVLRCSFLVLHFQLWPLLTCHIVRRPHGAPWAHRTRDSRKYPSLGGWRSIPHRTRQLLRA
jgi:hypothetical protein